MSYHQDFTEILKKDLKRLKKNRELLVKMKNKVLEIAENPYHYKPLRNVLKNRRRVHIGSYVLIFEIIESSKTVVFHVFRHHNEAYK